MDSTSSTAATEATELRTDILSHTSEIAAAYLANNAVTPDAIAGVLRTIRDTLLTIGAGPAHQEAAVEKQVPAVSIRRSVTPDYLVCLEDGKKLKMLKRHLRTMYNMTPDQYRAKWGLPADYPMVAPNYALQRSTFAKKIGLGRKAAPEPQKPAPKGAARRGRAKRA